MDLLDQYLEKRRGSLPTARSLLIWGLGSLLFGLGIMVAPFLAVVISGAWSRDWAWPIFGCGTAFLFAGSILMQASQTTLHMEQLQQRVADLESRPES